MRVLHIMGSADAGGVEMVVYNYMLNIDQNHIHFDIALTGHQPGMLGKKMVELGANIYQLPLKSKGIAAYEHALMDLLSREHFDIVHVHDNSTSYVALRIAKKCGIACRIAHAHTAGEPRRLRSKLIVQSGHILNKRYATCLMACGSKAGELVFGRDVLKKKRVIILPNAVDTEKFRFNSLIREQVHRELNIGSQYVIGMVGRLDHEKNYQFILPVIKKLHDYMPNILLIIVGRGNQEELLKKYCSDNYMDDYVKFIGARFDIERIYQVLDICLLPSLYEGFPVVAIEAIASGLPVILSDHITQELGFSKMVNYLPLEEKKWVDALLKKPINYNREKGADEIKQYHFDIKDSAGILQKIYERAEIRNETNYVV